MKKNTKKRLFPLLLLLISQMACSPNDDCSSYADSPPPFYASLKFIDAKTGENLLLNDKISKDDIQLKGSNNNHTSQTSITDTPRSTINFNLGTEHQQSKIYWEFSVKDRPTFIISFNAIESKTNNKCAGSRHYFYPDRESLKITDSNGQEIIEENREYIIKI